MKITSRNQFGQATTNASYEFVEPTSAALKQLKKVQSEKVSISAVKFSKGTAPTPVSDTEKVTLKAPKAKK